jgi:preprotein translocase subunit SecE
MTNETNEPGAEDLEAQGPAAEGEGEVAGAPAQLGLQRFVFAAYFVLAMLVAFIADKAVGVVWYRLSQWKPSFGEPREDVAIVLAVVAAIGTTLWSWKHENVRRLIEEVATELGQVTWPSKDDVGRSTAVVVGTTVLATLFFALMDALWRFLTNLVYGA